MEGPSEANALESLPVLSCLTIRRFKCHHGPTLFFMHILLLREL